MINDLCYVNSLFIGSLIVDFLFKQIGLLKSFRFFISDIRIDVFYFYLYWCNIRKFE
jgi:hypothetical protein